MLPQVAGTVCIPSGHNVSQYVQCSPLNNGSGGPVCLAAAGNLTSDLQSAAQENVSVISSAEQVGGSEVTTAASVLSISGREC